MTRTVHKYSEVVGLPVICIEDGKKIGTIEDVLLCPQKRQVKAFLLERRKYELNKRVIMLTDVLSLGKDAAIVKDCSCPIPLNKAASENDLKERGEIRGLRIFSKSGKELGIAKDILFDYRTGTIEGVEVSDGLLQDIIQGRRILPLFGKVEISAENILVGEEAEQEMESTGGGIRKKILKEGKE